MVLSRSLAVARNDWRILRRDPFPATILVVLPLLLIPFTTPAYRLAFINEHIRGLAGAEQAVPAMDVTFAFFLVANSSIAFFREHAWRTWDRLRASPASTAEILLGKVLILLLQATGQFAVLFGLGGLLVGFTVHGSWVELIMVGIAYSLFLVSLGVTVPAICHTYMQANAATNIGALLLAGLGGAIVPVAFLPGWAQSLAPASPSYWAVRGYRDAVLGHGGALASVAVLLTFAAALSVFAALRFRVEDTKIAWT